jgi:lipopolysaccharide transport system permease protein
MVRSLWSNRQLTGRLALREIQSRHKGFFLGILWIVILPLMMLCVYTFAFSVVFQARWGNAQGQSTAEFALILFAGLLVFNIFAETVGRAPSVIFENPSYVKKVVFPLEILPVVSVLGSLFNFAVGILVLLVFYVFVLGVPPLATLLVPLLIIPLIFMTLGVAWFIASIGVFFRDIKPMVATVTTALMFLSPIFYSLDAVSEKVRGFLLLNPLTLMLETVRGVLFFGQSPNWGAWLIQLIVSFAIAWGGFAWFMRTKKAFADVM